MPRLARLSRDRPARFGGRGGRGRRLVPDEESRDAIFRGPHGQAPAGGKAVHTVIFRQNADHGGEGRTGKTFLQSPEHVLGLRRAQLDQPIRVEPARRQTDRINRPLAKSLMRRKSPQDTTGTGPDDAGQQAKAEADGRRKIVLDRRQQFMQRANRQAVIGKGIVERRRAEMRDRPNFRGAARLFSEAPSQGLKVMCAVHGAPSTHPSRPVFRR